MRDSIGQTVEVGGYIAFSGMGNRVAEYGMIFAKVVEVGKKVKAVRLNVNYPDGKPVITRKFTHKSEGKFVYLERDIVESTIFPWFDDGYEFGEEESKIIAKWIHKGILG